MKNDFSLNLYNNSISNVKIRKWKDRRISILLLRVYKYKKRFRIGPWVLRAQFQFDKISVRIKSRGTCDLNRPVQPIIKSKNPSKNKNSSRQFLTKHSYSHIGRRRYNFVGRKWNNKCWYRSQLSCICY